MKEVSKKHQDRLPDIKKKIEEAEEYFRPNVRRYDKFTKFVFKSSMTDDEAAGLSSTGKPAIEFNILEALISRLRGEFAKQEPNLSVRASDGVPISMLTPDFTEMMSLIEAHLKCIFFDGTNDMFDYNVYSDLLAGGFSVAKVYTEYVNEKSFEQNIYIDRVFDPTLTFFDPLARKSHKGDGRFCGELYPMTIDDFKDKFGEELASEMKFSKDLAGFNWSFQNESEKVVLVADYYEKKKRKETIYRLSSGQSVTKRQYEKEMQEWDLIQQPPVVLSERKTEFEYICRYRICENRVLDYVETDYRYFPLVFIDGNSVYLRESGSYRQLTRPYVYHAEGIQKLKNFAGQSLANELENTIQHKFIVPIEAVPEDYQSAYQNVQKADVLMYNHFMDGNPGTPLPPPREVQRTPIPPEITNTFRMTDEMTQMILGSYDSQQGVQSGQLSGVALARGAIQSNNASVPYIVGYIKGLNRIAQIIVDLIPKYYRTPRTLPVKTPDGKRSFVYINDNPKNSIYMNYDPDTLQVKVEAGVNFSMQKEMALQTIVNLSQASPSFAQFFNEEGLPILLDNIDIRGVDQLKQKANAWMQKQSQAAQQQQQMAQQQQQMEMQQQAMNMAMMQKEAQAPAQTVVEMQAVEQNTAIEQARISVKAQEAETKLIEVIAKIDNEKAKSELNAAKVTAEQTRSAIDAAINISKHQKEKESKNEESSERDD